MQLPKDFEDYALQCLKEVSDYLGVSQLCILSRSKQEKVCQARRIWMHLLLPHTTQSLLGKALGMTHVSIGWMIKLHPEDHNKLSVLRLWSIGLKPPKPWMLPQCMYTSKNRCPMCDEVTREVPYFPSKVRECTKCGFMWRVKKHAPTIDQQVMKEIP